MSFAFALNCTCPLALNVTPVAAAHRDSGVDPVLVGGHTNLSAGCRGRGAGAARPVAGGVSTARAAGERDRCAVLRSRGNPVLPVVRVHRDAQRLIAADVVDVPVTDLAVGEHNQVLASLDLAHLVDGEV